MYLFAINRSIIGKRLSGKWYNLNGPFETDHDRMVDNKWTGGVGDLVVLSVSDNNDIFIIF